MIRQVPIAATLIVLIAAGVMVRLGFWQLDRLHQKEALLARYAAAQSMDSDVPWPSGKEAAEQVLFRHATLTCVEVGLDAPMAGHNDKGQTGWAHTFPCRLADGSSATVAIGWSEDPASRNWAGKEIGGMIGPGPRLIADQPEAGLARLARPDPREIPNNHFAYAVQWFLFAFTALVIYALALRKRLAAG